MDKPLLGAHVSVAGGYVNGLVAGEAMGAEVIQIFGSSPRQWHVRMPTEKEAGDFLVRRKDSLVKEVYLHAPYLINLASPKKELCEKSVTQLAGHLQIANMIKAKGLIFHVGSATGTDEKKALAQAVNGMKEVLERAPGKSYLIMENSASHKKVGSTIDELAKMLKGVGSGRLRVCFDTAHSFTAGLMGGYTSESIKKFVDEIDKKIGLENLVAIHVNDSKGEMGSNIDRHENIGEGYIGKAYFKNLFKEKRLWGADWMLEVPGFDGRGPDEKNLDILKNLLG